MPDRSRGGASAAGVTAFNAAQQNCSGGLLNGVLYFPKAAMTFNGGTSGTATNTTIVADTLSFVGNSYINAPASTPYTGFQSGGTYLVQ